jgi:hypothetical protein
MIEKMDEHKIGKEAVRRKLEDSGIVPGGVVISYFLTPLKDGFRANTIRSAFGKHDWLITMKMALPRSLENTVRALVEWLAAHPPFPVLLTILKSLRQITNDFHPVILPFLANSHAIATFAVRHVSSLYAKSLGPKYSQIFNDLADMEHITENTLCVLQILTSILRIYGGPMQANDYQYLYANEIMAAYHAIYDTEDAIEQAHRLTMDKNDQNSPLSGSYTAACPKYWTCCVRLVGISIQGRSG